MSCHGATSMQSIGMCPNPALDGHQMPNAKVARDQRSVMSHNQYIFDVYLCLLHPHMVYYPLNYSFQSHKCNSVCHFSMVHKICAQSSIGLSHQMPKRDVSWPQTLYLSCLLLDPHMVYPKPLIILVYISQRV